MRGVNIAHIKCLVRNFSAFKLPRGAFAIGGDRGCPDPALQERNPARFSVLPGKNAFTNERRVPGESLLHLVGPKSRMASGPPGPDLETPGKLRPVVFYCYLNDEEQ